MANLETVTDLKPDIDTSVSESEPPLHACFQLADDSFKEHGLQLEMVPIVDLITGKTKYVTVPIMLEDRASGARKRGRLLWAQFCPFCGKALREDVLNPQEVNLRAVPKSLIDVDIDDGT